MKFSGRVNCFACLAGFINVVVRFQTQLKKRNFTPFDLRNIRHIPAKNVCQTKTCVDAFPPRQYTRKSTRRKRRNVIRIRDTRSCVCVTLKNSRPQVARSAKMHQRTCCSPRYRQAKNALTIVEKQAIQTDLSDYVCPQKAALHY